MSRDLEFPTLYQTAPHQCPYLEEQTAVNLILDPTFRVDVRTYQQLLSSGFRRNGGIFYRPFCNACAECCSVRIPVAEFQPNRAQRRTLARNADLQMKVARPYFSEEHFSLYLKYQALRHPGDSMDDPDPEKYQRFLIDSDVDTLFMEFRTRDTLVCVAIVDRLPNALSAIYTFYDPLQAKRSAGTFAVLKQVELAQKLGLTYVYLGYWIKSCDKMSYKSNFRPLERFDTVKAQWLRMRG